MTMTTTLSVLGLHDVTELVRTSRPVASVYVGPLTDRADDAELELLLRRRRIGRHLGEQGASNATIDAAVGHLARLPEYHAEYAVFARDGEVRLAQSLPGAVDADLAAYSAPAKVAPLLAWLQAHPAYVRVVIDRAGADLTAYPAGALTGIGRTVVGPDDDLRRRFPGGGQRPRMQRRAEDSWRHNAMAVAAACGEELARVRAELLLIAGDPRAVQLVTVHLRQSGRPPSVRLLPGGRHDDGSASARDRATARILAEHGRAKNTAMLTAIADHLGPRGTAVQGVSATIAALAAGDISTLLVVDDPADRRTGWFGPELLCSAEHPGLVMPDRQAQRGRLVDIVIRAGLVTRADVRILLPAEGAGLVGGLGGLLRHA
jgi:hypothetical protein